MENKNTIDLKSEEIKNFCEKYHIKSLSIFGSLIHGDSRDNSDIDILVEFLPGFTPGFSFVRIQEELSEMLHRNVDLHTPGSLSKYFRDTVVKEAQIIYAKH
ncbi:MAG: nucleotidyltransferase family protein [Nanoarchaeota archaeon]|nr:nucleotidyltransferase family protein [Nanoarchaeota archaeon]